MRQLGLVLVAFVVMEPVTAATHRWVMHGVGAFLHRSHHRRRTGRFEANDWFPVLFAAVVCLGLWVGFNRPGWSDLVPVGVGVTLYGAAYALVHDVHIHGRLPRLGRLLAPPGRRRTELLDRLAAAHRIHHLYGRAPYGMLAPVVPAELRERAERTTRDPLRERLTGAGSR
jgi:beta-carotene 3-hydroxylase